MTTADAPSMYLQGNFAPVDRERTITDLEVTGTIPPSLSGRYVRTGPNPTTTDLPNYHWFMGDGMVHGVRLEGGTAQWYRNRWVRSPEVSRFLGEGPVPRDDGGWYPGTGNTNVVHHAGRMWAITEGSLPYELTPELDTAGARGFGGLLPGGLNAHPKFHPDTNELHGVSYGFEQPSLRYHVVGAGGQLVHSADIEMNGAVMVHDLGFTASRLVLFDLPVVFSWDKVMAGSGIPFVWDPDHHSRVGVLPHRGTAADVVWIDVEPCFVYHPLNAWDEGDAIVLDLSVHNHAFVDDVGTPGGNVVSLQRWTIDPVAGKVSADVLDDRPQDFPRADERRAGRRHRFGYTLGESSLEALGGLGQDPRTFLYKHDFVTGASDVFDFGLGRIASEFVFVPDDEAAGEDEGYLMGYVWDAPTDRSDLVILDARDFPREVARVHLPVAVPQGFHGNWVPDRALT